MNRLATAWERVATLGVILIAASIALASARDHPGSWNDGSRLATVEGLVDHGTWAIDDSIFAPGTRDKMYIDGHFYSDKSPVPALLLALFYGCCKTFFGLCASTQPESFCWLLTAASCGTAYVAAVLAFFKMGRILELSPSARWLLTASFALASLALVYTRYVNNHLPLLGVAAVLMLAFTVLAKRLERGAQPSWLLLAIGGLAGLGYCIDLGTGPPMLAWAGLLTTWRCRRVRAVALFALGALPWVAAHHVLNYAIGGSWGPANAVPEHFQWPGSPFSADSLTGSCHHANLGSFLKYAVELLVGVHGFVSHNVPLFLLVAAGAVLLRLRPREWPELLFAAMYCGSTWLLYAALSNNFAGLCCSVRWFVPLLAPAYFILAVLLKYAPEYRIDLLLLTICGTLLAGQAWIDGPWSNNLVPGFGLLQVAAVTICVLLSGKRWFDSRRPQGPANSIIVTP